MNLELASSLTVTHWLLLFLCGMLIGTAKGGINGAGMLAVPIVATIFGGKASTGLILPMLMFADFLAVRHYNRHAAWPFIRRLIPATAIGVIIGTVVGVYVNDQVFKWMMAILIMISLGLMIWQERRPISSTITGGWYFGSFFGLLGGFSTMVGNAAGPVMIVYLLAVGLPKNQFLGTGAWFFLIMNWFKLPFHIFAWKTISEETLLIDLILFPSIILGVWSGIRIVRILPEKEFRYLMIGMTFVVAFRLFF